MSNNNDRKGRAKDVRGAFFPTPVAPSDMPDWYGDMLGSIKELIANGRRQVMWTANVQMSMMYYRIGQTIIQRQNSEGWGSKVADRLSADLKKRFLKCTDSRLAIYTRNTSQVSKFISQLPFSVLSHWYFCDIRVHQA